MVEELTAKQKQKLPKALQEAILKSRAKKGGSKKGDASKTHKNDKDYTTKKGNKDFHEKDKDVKKKSKPFVKKKKTGGELKRQYQAKQKAMKTLPVKEKFKTR